MSKKTKIYTDGGCHGNPGPGAWAFAVADDAGVSKSGRDSNTTNNKMELEAVIQAILWCEANDLGKDVVIVTDSQYVKNGITSWIHNWVRNGWKTSKKTAVKNRELWMRLYELTHRVEIEWEWVKGHSGNHFNEICDNLVQLELQ